MLYDIIAILNILFCIYATWNLLAVISRSRKKQYEPPYIRKKHIIGLFALLSIPSISIGVITRVVYTGLYKDSLFVIFGTIACVAMLLTSIQFSIISKEREFSIIDVDSDAFSDT